MSLIFIGILCFMIVDGYGQSTVFKVTNEKGEGLDLAAIQISTLHREWSGYTNDLGLFDANIPKDSMLRIQVSYIGLTTLDKSIEAASIGDTCTLMLTPLPYELDEVVITGLKKIIARENDNFVMLINGSKTMGSNAVEILKNAPGLVYNNDAISIMGKEVLIEIDGKISPMTSNQLSNLLKSKDASSIQKIEIIMNPGSKYPASADKRVINIITNKIYNGYQCSLYGDLTKRSKDFSISIMPSLNISYNKWSCSINGGYDNIRSREIRSYSQLDKTTSVNVFDDNSLKSQNYGPQATATIDYNLTNNMVIGAKFNTYAYQNNGYLGGSSFAELSSQTIFRGEISDTTIQKGNFSNLNINSKINLPRSGSYINLDLDYGTQNNEIDMNQVFFQNDLLSMQQSSRNILQQLNSNNKFQAANLEWGKNIGNTKLSIGFQVNHSSIKQNINEDSPFVPNGISANEIKYNETIVSSFQELGFRLGPFDLLLSNRLERTNYSAYLQSENFKSDSNYINSFPLFKISRSFGKHYFSANYKRQIRRPRFQDFIPFKRYTSAYSYYTGNPSLLPYFPSSGSLYYSFDNFIWINASYQHAKNTVTEYESIISGTNLRQGLRSNIGTSSSLITSIGFNKRVNSNFNFNSSFSYITGYQEARIDDSNIRFNYRAYNFYINASYNIKGVKIAPNLYYNSDIYYGVAQTLNYWYLNLLISKSMFNDMGDISLSINDLFLKGITRYINDYTNIDLFASNNWDSRRVTLSITYNFGKSDIKYTRNRNNTANQSSFNRL